MIRLNSISLCFSVSQRVMDEAYKLIAHTYLKHLIQNSQHKLKRWNPDIGQTVSIDAHQLHTVISDLVREKTFLVIQVIQVIQVVFSPLTVVNLWFVCFVLYQAPGVQPWNLILLKIPEVLNCRSIDTLKIILGYMEKECVEQRYAMLF